MFTKKFLIDAAERAVRTFVQAFAASVVVSQAVSLGDLKVAGIAGVLAVATSVAGSQFGSKTSGSFVPPAEPVAPVTPVVPAPPA